jgi:hypothetical protein
MRFFNLRSFAAVILGLYCACATAQYSPYLAQPTTNTSTLGNQAHDTVDSGNNNNAVGSIWYTGSKPITVTSCTVWVGTGAVGGLVDCGVLAAPTTTTNGGTWICHGTFTEASSTTNAFMTASLPGCTLSAYSMYWIVLNTNDASLVNGATACGSSCSGVPNSGTQDGFYTPIAYGTYTGVPTTWEGNTGLQETIYLTYTVSNSGVVRTGSSFF